MIIDDIGIIINSRKFGENALIIDCFLRDHGLYKGYYRIPRNKKNPGTDIIVGNIVAVRWQARLAEQLGSYRFEIIDNIVSKVAFSKLELAILNSVIQLLNLTINEKEPLAELFEQTTYILSLLYNESIQLSDKLHTYILFELTMLRQAGFAMDLHKCAVTANKKNLVYVSPRTGRAVCDEVGIPYAEKLLKLPHFLAYNTHPQNAEELLSAFNLCGFFLQKLFAHEYLRPNQLTYRQQIENYLRQQV
jgi:DNA repair protein RecO (recombination protein O)